MKYTAARRIGIAMTALTAMVALGVGCSDASDVGLGSSEQAVGTPTVTTSAPSYNTAQPIVVNYSNMPGNMYDWVSVAVAGSPSTSYIRFAFTNGQVMGSQTFPAMAVGNYEARIYSNDTFTLLGSSPFTVVPAPAVTTDKQAYIPGQTITVSYTGMPGNMMDYVAVSTAGSADTSTLQRFFTNGAVNGTQPFTGLPAGNYEARAYLNNTSTVLARHQFSVSNATLTTDASSYPVGATVQVTYSGLPGNTNDWISIANYGSATTQYVQWHYTGGGTSGTMNFTGLAAGTYEARAYPKNTYNLLTRSAPFTVGGSTCTIPPTSPVFSGEQSGDLTIAANSQTATAPLTVDLTQSFLITSLRENEGSPDFGATICDLHAAITGSNPVPAGVTCHRNNLGTDNPGSDGTITVHWTVVTFSSGVLVQRGDANTGTTDPTTVTLGTAIDPTQSFVLLNGIQTGGTGWGSNEFVKANIVDGSTLNIQTFVGGSKISWQVVQMVGSSVQRGSVSFATADVEKTATISAVPSGSFVLATYTSDNAGSLAAAALMLQATLTNSTTVDMKREQGGSNLVVGWEAISLPFATHSGVTTFAVGETSASPGVANIAMASSVAVASGQAILGQSGGTTTYNGSLQDLVGEGTVSLATSAGGVTIQRTPSSSSATIPWTVIDFAHNCAGM